MLDWFFTRCNALGFVFCMIVFVWFRKEHNLLSTFFSRLHLSPYCRLVGSSLDVLHTLDGMIRILIIRKSVCQLSPVQSELSEQLLPCDRCRSLD